MQSRLFLLLITFGPLVSVSSVSSAAESQSPVGAEEHFDSVIAGLLEKNCLKCHSGSKPKGGLDLTTRDAVLKGGDSGPAVDLAQPDSSVLLKAVNYDGYEMPPTGRLAPGQIEALRKWVSEGLIWAADGQRLKFEPPKEAPTVNEETKKHWAFQPVARTPVPDSDSSWGNNEIDGFILNQLRSHGLQPNPRAEPGELVRRAYYDLLGLPPEPHEVSAFESDASPQAWAALVDRLLASPHYGEQWGRHWLDLVRYAETNSYERDGAKPFAWRYRDYVIQAFNADKPYNQFLREQLAGDELPNGSPDAIIATGFYRLGRWDDEPADPELAYYDDLDDILTTLGQSVLGLTVNCARCHDHKIDPVSQRDYYSLLAFFRGVRRYGVRSADSVMEASVTQIARPENSELHQAAIRRHEQELENTETELKKIEDIVVPDFTGVEKDEFQYEVNRTRLIEARKGGLLTDKQVGRYRSLASRRKYLRENPPSAMAQALCVKEDISSIPATHVLLRGSPGSPGDEVQPRFPEVLSPPAPEFPAVPAGVASSGRRTALANWLTSAKNPLTARVMVNRIWQYHFGRGIVRTASDFGFQGSRPTHPELLDWLAARFMEDGWSLKSMHRLILLSATWQMSSRGQSAGLEQDPTNEHFWRVDMRRLTAEEIRDSILWANGTLNAERMYGPSIYTRIPDEVKAGQSQPGAGWGVSSSEDAARRSIYIHVKRSLRDPLLESFDMADTDLTCPIRFATTQPTQALGLLNSAFIQEQAAVFSQLMCTSESEPAAQVRFALRRVTQREPSEAEVERGVRLLRTLQQENGLSEEQARRSFCLVALNLNEFLYLD